MAIKKEKAKIKIPKVLTLDLNKWICGVPQDFGLSAKEKKTNTLGRGETVMANPQGFRCCLGQFAPQLNPTIKRKDLLDNGNPEDTRCDIPLLVNEAGKNTRLTNSAININDNEKTTVKTKIEKLKTIFGKAGIKIKVIPLKKKK